MKPFASQHLIFHACPWEAIFSPLQHLPVSDHSQASPSPPWGQQYPFGRHPPASNAAAESKARCCLTHGITLLVPAPLLSQSPKSKVTTGSTGAGIRSLVVISLHLESPYTHFPRDFLFSTAFRGFNYLHILKITARMERLQG